MHHVVYKVEVKEQAVRSPLPRASPLTLGFMARAGLQVVVLADQEFRNYLMMLMDRQIPPSSSLFAFGLLSNKNRKGNISSINTGFI